MPCNDARQAFWAELYVPSFSVAFKFMLLCRLLSAAANIIHDCDETFNYWEPLHHWLYGSGLQTWEYSPEFAIRSYAYVLYHGIVGKLATIIYPHKVHVFYAVRIFIAAWSAYCDSKLYEAVVQKDRRTGLLLLAMLGLSAGMFVASSSFLPSSFGMSWVTLALAAWLQVSNRAERRPDADRGSASVYFPIAIASIGVAVLLGWPFCGAMGIPIAIDFLFVRRQVARFVTATLMALFGVLAPILVVDYYYYGKAVLVPLSIVLYNVLGASAGRGPELYGTEPWTFYVLNLLLNLNIAFPLALLSVPLLAVARPWNVTISSLLQLSAPLLWLAIFFVQAHKEERFLYVVYPWMLWQAAVSLRCIWALLDRIALRFASRRWHEMPMFLVLGAVFVFMALSVSRTSAVVLNYGAAMETWRSMSTLLPAAPPATFTDRSVCVGKEWYRFSSSFFLPEPYRLSFIRSEFRGLLPKYYEASGIEGTRRVPSGFNDMNREDTSRYVSIDRCAYVVDLCLHRPGETCIDSEGRFEKLACLPFVDAAQSPSWSRAFYIPALSSSRNNYGDYCVYKKKAVVIVDKKPVISPDDNDDDLYD